MPSGERRAIAAAVFTYFRWLGWLDEKESIQVGIGKALEFQQRFDANPKALKDATITAFAVPPWIMDELDFGASPVANGCKTAWVRSLQSPSPLWIRARPSQSPALATALGSTGQ